MASSIFPFAWWMSTFATSRRGTPAWSRQPWSTSSFRSWAAAIKQCQARRLIWRARPWVNRYISRETSRGNRARSHPAHFKWAAR